MKIKHIKLFIILTICVLLIAYITWFILPLMGKTIHEKYDFTKVASVKILRTNIEKYDDIVIDKLLLSAYEQNFDKDLFMESIPKAQFVRPYTCFSIPWWRIRKSAVIIFNYNTPQKLGAGLG